MKILADVSRLFLWGFDGTSVSRSLKKVLQSYPPAGVILFRRNIETPRQLKSLITRLQSISPQPLLIGVDQEGGRVSRLPVPWTQYPPAATWGSLYQRLKSPRLLQKIGRFMGKELASVGFNLNFAPVLDVHSNPKNPVIGDRAFSSQSQTVIETALPFARGLIEGGVIPCGKHFPGHGDTAVDSHLTLPYVKRPLISLKKIELPPFQAAIRAHLPALMTAHVVYEELDPKNPATLSPLILEKLLRSQLGFNGVLFSDDLEMKAIQYPLQEAIELAFIAGVDILMICKRYEERAFLIEAFAKTVSQSKVLKERLKGSLQRVNRLKKKYLKMMS